MTWSFRDVYLNPLSELEIPAIEYHIAALFISAEPGCVFCVNRNQIAGSEGIYEHIKCFGRCMAACMNMFKGNTTASEIRN